MDSKGLNRKAREPEYVDRPRRPSLEIVDRYFGRILATVRESVGHERDAEEITWCVLGDIQTRYLPPNAPPKCWNAVISRVTLHKVADYIADKKRQRKISRAATFVAETRGLEVADIQLLHAEQNDLMEKLRPVLDATLVREMSGRHFWSEICNNRQVVERNLGRGRVHRSLQKLLERVTLVLKKEMREGKNDHE
ncbi:hypothetical protein Pan44_10400 [Caulifigura coniformis]|uniref:RNA polymerase sigma factor n=1 Tax=Caulifigura coniformis TaxID=2527983 RepID=A0A517SA52_9PLAN|nr:hypothetical protein Pan44_10400 [Caulifigura coniformis]